jgi:small-conductance mechanosensitive channel
MEELALENDTLKTVIDKQAKRIQMWELNSQNSFNALAQSFRARGPGRGSSDPNALAHALASQGINHLPALPSPPIPDQTQQQQQPTSPNHPSTSTPDADAVKRIADLEAMLASQNAKVNDLMSNNEKLAKQNERNTQVLSRYREQWEKLKAGARKKEQERRERKVPEGKPEESMKESEATEAPGEEGEEELEDEPGFGKA